MDTIQAKRDAAWLSPSQLAAALDVRQDYCRREIIPNLPAAARRRKGRSILVHGRLAIEHYLTRRLEERVRKQLLREREEAEQVRSVQEEEDFVSLNCLLIGIGGDS
jgi:hypothetical protein